MQTVLISGGSGMIGQLLSKRLRDSGYHVQILSTDQSASDGLSTLYWQIAEKVIDKKAVNSADFIIHLAGANIGEERWTAQRKQLIQDSRVKSAQLIYEALDADKNKLKAFITASAVGYYGATDSDKIFSEEAPAADDFLGTTCRLWEAAADRFAELGIRTVKIRTGIVLTRHGGALEKMAAPVKIGIGSALGNGKQYLPWIHVDDLCQIYIRAIEDANMKGAYNSVTPDHRTNKDFTRALALALKKPFWFPPVPAILLKLLFGEMAVLLLKGSRVSCRKIVATGFSFKFPRLEMALEDLVGQKDQPGK